MSYDEEIAGRVAERMKVLAEKYAGEFPKRTDEIEALWGKIEQGESGDVLDELYRVIHGLSGSGETFGYPQLSEAARRCERVLKDGLDSGDLQVADARTQIGHVLAELAV